MFALQFIRYMNSMSVNSMKKQYRQNIFPLLIAILFASGNGFSLLAQEYAGIPFLKMNIGSRAEAMGGAYTAIANGPNALYYNPAGLGLNANRELMLYHTQWFSNISVENLTFSYPLNRRWSFGSGISFLHMPTFDRYEIDPATGGPVEAGKFSAYDMVFTAGLGIHVIDNIYLGSSLKIIREKLASVSATGFAADFGILATIPASGIRMGFAVQNLGSKIQYLATKSTLPLTYRAGIAYQFQHRNNTIALDVIKPIDEAVQFLPGVEVGISENFSIRGGYQPTQREANGFSAGFGLQMPEGFKINYAYTPYGDLGDAHRAELIINLGRVATNTVPSNESRGNDERMLKAREKINVTKRDASSSSIHPAEVMKQLVPPKNLQILNLANDKMKITWQPVALKNIKYNVYAKHTDGDKWIKLTPNPISRNSQLFALKRTKVRLIFAVTTVRDGLESKFSTPLAFAAP